MLYIRSHSFDPSFPAGLAPATVCMIMTSVNPFAYQGSAKMTILRQRMSDLDLQIAAIALQHGAPFVSHNRSTSRGAGASARRLARMDAEY